MKTIESISISPSGYGHKRVTINISDGTNLCAVTSRVDVTDDILGATHETEEAYVNATKRVIGIVLNANGIEYDEINILTHPYYGLQWEVKGWNE